MGRQEVVRILGILFLQFCLLLPIWAAPPPGIKFELLSLIVSFLIGSDLIASLWTADTSIPDFWFDHSSSAAFLEPLTWSVRSACARAPFIEIDSSSCVFPKKRKKSVWTLIWFSASPAFYLVWGGFTIATSCAVWIGVWGQFRIMTQPN